MDISDILLPSHYDRKRNAPLRVHTVTFENKGFSVQVSWCNYNRRYETWMEAEGIARSNTKLPKEYKYQYYSVRLA